MALALIIVLPVFVGLSFMAITPGFTEGMTKALKDTLGPLGYAISWGLVASVKMARYLTRSIGAWILDSSALVVGWISTLAHIVDYTLARALLWPLYLFRVTYWMLDVEIPRLIRALPNAASDLFHGLERRVGSFGRTLGIVTRYLQKYARQISVSVITAALAPWLVPLRWLRAHAGTLGHVVPRVLGLPSARDWTNLNKRINKLSRRIAPAAFLAATVAALGRLGLHWIRCRKVGRVGRQLCGMDEGFLESLLGDAVAIFSIVSIVEFATELRAVEDEAIAIMGKLVREWPA